MRHPRSWSRSRRFLLGVAALAALVGVTLLAACPPPVVIGPGSPPPTTPPPTTPPPTTPPPTTPPPTTPPPTTPPSACAPQDCGPAMAMPNHRCSDGSMGGPTGTCVRNPDGRCGWEVRKCPASSECIRTGCSSTICTERGNEIMTTCEMRPEYQCYASAKCELQANGACGWTQTAALTQCLSAAAHK